MCGVACGEPGVFSDPPGWVTVLRYLSLKTRDAERDRIAAQQTQRPGSVAVPSRAGHWSSTKRAQSHRTGCGAHRLRPGPRGPRRGRRTHGGLLLTGAALPTYQTQPGRSLPYQGSGAPRRLQQGRRDGDDHCWGGSVLNLRLGHPVRRCRPAAGANSAEPAEVLRCQLEDHFEPRSRSPQRGPARQSEPRDQRHVRASVQPAIG
jgi:hypothetical protein